MSKSLAETICCFGISCWISRPHHCQPTWYHRPYAEWARDQPDPVVLKPRVRLLRIGQLNEYNFKWIFPMFVINIFLKICSTNILHSRHMPINDNIGVTKDGKFLFKKIEFSAYLGSMMLFIHSLLRISRRPTGEEINNPFVVREKAKPGQKGKIRWEKKERNDGSSSSSFTFCAFRSVSTDIWMKNRQIYWKLYGTSSPGIIDQFSAVIFCNFSLKIILCRSAEILQKWAAFLTFKITKEIVSAC